MPLLIDKISAGCAIIAFLSFIMYSFYNDKKTPLEDVVIVIIAGGMLPVTIAIILYPIAPFISLERMSLQISIMGLVLLYVYCKTIINKIWPNDSS